MNLLGAIFAKLDWSRKEVAAGLLLKLLATGDTWKVDEGVLDDTRLALCGLDDPLGEAVARQ